MVTPILPAPATTMCFMAGIVGKCRAGRYCQSADGPAMFRRFAQDLRRFVAPHSSHGMKPRPQPLDATDQKLIALLREDARAATAELARKLGLSRTTVQSRIEKLERT